MTRGFSLIETIVYIALLALLMAGAILTTYEITRSSYLVGERDTTQEEGNFVLRKIEAAMVGARSLPTVSGSTLEIDPYVGSNVTFALSGAHVELNGVPITTDNVKVDALTFTSIAGTPEGVTVLLTLDGKDFTLTQHVR